ncbi:MULTISPECIES: hypothetical protein [unclassified Lentimonas]|uniref:HzsA-related protein n=1 Tax=unclassified Lentimonas TaxID=2630993 RepID=UPI001389F885|nr:MULTISPECIES: hypothetical protein [unclassified Lentimonas]
MKQIYPIKCIAMVGALFFSLSASAADANQAKLDSLEAAVRHLSATYPDSYTDDARLLEDIGKLHAVEGAAFDQAFVDVQREALLAHPDLQKYPLVFVERKQYPKDHHNTGTIFQTGEINHRSVNAVLGCQIGSVRLSDGEQQTLFATEGVLRDIEVSFDAKRILFSMRTGADTDYKIYEMDSSCQPKQLTFQSAVSDIDPFYMSGGKIGFSSTRDPKFCACNRHIMANLYTMNQDGTNIAQIGKSIEFEGHGVQLADGTILYNRWEYVDRNFGGGQGLWLSNPDGTNHRLYYGQSTPHAILNARPIPGTDQVICVFSSCHDRPWGALAILDRNKGLEGREPIVQMWPASAIDLVKDESSQYGGSGGFDVFRKVNPKYEDPYAIDSNFFLVSRSDSGASSQIYLVDTFGNEISVYASQGELGAFDPFLMRPHPEPRNLPRRVDYSKDRGYFYVTNVYEGTHMEGVEPGDVKYLRVIENPPKLTWTPQSWGGQGAQAPAMNWHDFDNKKILGTVPVEADGSAFFEVPADLFVYFQVLDENKRMLQSMRSGVIAQPGEMNGCIGCHEDRYDAPQTDPSYTSMAFKRAPSPMDGWLGEIRDFNYLRDVQPVFDMYCIECHDYGKEAGESLNLSRDLTLVFNTSYMELHKKGMLNTVGGGPNDVLEAKSWGSTQSRLIKVLEEGHYDVEISPSAYERVVTWIDLNAPYYPTYASAYRNSPAGRVPLSNKELARLLELAGLKVRLRHGMPVLVSFDRPELSPILSQLDRGSSAYQEALEIIRGGADRLKKTPRGDLPGFVPAEEDRQRIETSAEFWAEELKRRAAIQSGEKIDDHGQRVN